MSYFWEYDETPYISSLNLVLYSSIIIIIIILIVIIDKVFSDNKRGSFVMILEKDTAKHIAVPIVLVLS